MDNGQLNTDKKSLSVQEASAHYQLSAGNAPSLPSGYKQTEVGVIPEDWEVKQLDDTVRIRGVRMNPRIEKSDFCIELEHISQGAGKLLGSIETSDRTSLKNRFESGDVLFGKLRSYLKKYWHAGRAGVCSTEIWPLVPKDFHLLNTYLYQIVQTDSFVDASCESYGTHMPRSDWKSLRQFKFPLPPTKAEQEAITEALSDADALIESLGQLIAKKCFIKQGTMQELLTGKKRLPGFSWKWDVKQLGDLGYFLKGSGIRKNESFSGDLPCIRYGEIYTKHNDYIKTFYSWISQEVAVTARQLKQGDLLFAGSGETKEEIGKCVAFVNDIEAYAGGDIVILRPQNSSPTFLGYYLNTAPINRQKASRGQGDAVVHISATALSSIEINIPTFEEQTAIATILSDMDAEIAALEEKLAKTRALKQGMMHNLLTGRIRLIGQTIPVNLPTLQPSKENSHE